MTTEQRRMIEILNQCSFLPESADKRFIRDQAALIKLRTQAKEPQESWKPLTEKQGAWLLLLFHKYRRQHGACRCDACRNGAKK